MVWRQEGSLAGPVTPITFRSDTLSSCSQLCSQLESTGEDLMDAWEVQPSRTV